MSIQLFIGTVKGAFVARSDDSRANWEIEGPLFKGWGVSAATRLADGRYAAATSSYVYGAQVHTSSDLKEWEALEAAPQYEADDGPKLEQIWTLRTVGDRLYAGVAEAGLFRSNGDFSKWEAVEGLNHHSTRSGWQPGMGGLCAHVMLGNEERMWCGISAVGVFRSDDGGTTWEPRNEGVTQIVPDKDHPSIGYCVHGLAADPHDPDRIYRQDHTGVYRTTNGGDSWERIEEGLPARFGFPVSVDAKGNVYVIPLESDEYRMPKGGRLRVFRSTDGGDAWEPLANGLPQENAYTNVLRGAMAVDARDPVGLYFGTTGGDVYTSADGGASWDRLPIRLPRVQCVEVFAS